MEDISVKFIEKYRLEIKGSSIIIDYLKNCFLAKETKSFKITYKSGKTVIKSKTKLIPIYIENDEYRSNSILIDAGFIDYLASFLSKLSSQGIQLNLDLCLPKLDPIIISPKWKDILSGLNYEYQIKCVDKLILSYGGIAELFTSAGKTEMMLAIMDCFKGQSIILVPNSKAGIPNIVNRAKQYEITVPDKIDIDSKINVINAVGFLNSNLAKDSKILKYLSEIEMVVVDECHHLSSISHRIFFNILDNIKRSYAFSATPDTDKGLLYSVTETKLTQLESDQTRIIGLSGSVKTKIENPIQATLVKVFCNTGNSLTNCKNWFEALDLFVTDVKLAQMIKHLLINKFPDVKFYIPVFKKETGIELYHNLVKQGISCVFWSSGTILPKKIKKKKKKELDCISDFMNNSDCRVLISTTIAFEIVNIKSLGGIIPLHGENYRMTTQPIGRASRNREVIIVLFYDESNRLVLSQMKKRRINIEKTYKIAENIIIRL